MIDLSGGCHCGAIRYHVKGAAPRHNALCHCLDCRKSAGAPMVSWAAFAHSEVTVTAGKTQTYASSEHGRRHFCSICGTGLFYTNDVVLPGVTDIQTATLDDPGLLPPDAQVQRADRIGWIDQAHTLPGFDRYPGPDA